MERNYVTVTLCIHGIGTLAFIALTLSVGARKSIRPVKLE